MLGKTFQPLIVSTSKVGIIHGRLFYGRLSYATICQQDKAKAKENKMACSPPANYSSDLVSHGKNRRATEFAVQQNGKDDDSVLLS
jgi:hypothetical protein